MSKRKMQNLPESAVILKEVGQKAQMINYKAPQVFDAEGPLLS